MSSGNFKKVFISYQKPIQANFQFFILCRKTMRKRSEI